MHLESVYATWYCKPWVICFCSTACNELYLMLPLDLVPETSRPECQTSECPRRGRCRAPGWRRNRGSAPWPRRGAAPSARSRMAPSSEFPAALRIRLEGWCCRQIGAGRSRSTRRRSQAEPSDPRLAGKLLSSRRTPPKLRTRLTMPQPQFHPSSWWEEVKHRTRWSN